jgi:PleD family two-component response regulator
MFDIYAGEINAHAEEPWEEVRIAKGVAEFDPRKDISVESVLQRADEKMYADKKRYKSMRHPYGVVGSFTIGAM